MKDLRLTWVIPGDPLQSVDNKLIMVDTLGEDLVSEVVVVGPPGVVLTVGTL